MSKFRLDMGDDEVELDDVASCLIGLMPCGIAHGIFRSLSIMKGMWCWKCGLEYVDRVRA